MVDFSADVKPILNKKCISCRGGITAQGGFSVLFREEAITVTSSGKPDIILGDLKRSEMIGRLTISDLEERMSCKYEPLSKGEIGILKKWVKQGVQLGENWTYVPLWKTDVPDENNDWVKNGIDKFIYQKLEVQKLRPSAEADKPTLLRRISLDLIGRYSEDALVQRFLGSN